MTFTFNEFSGLLFFMSFGFAFLIVAGRFEGAGKHKKTDCPMHPHQDICAHRRKK